METFNNLVIYIFHATPGRAFQYYYFIGAVCVALIGVGIILKIYLKKNRQDKTFRKLFKKSPKKVWLMAACFAIYLLARNSYVPFFSMRFILYLLLGITVYMFYQMISTYLKVYPEEKKRRKEALEQNRYTIKKKKGKKKRR